MSNAWLGVIAASMDITNGPTRQLSSLGVNYAPAIAQAAARHNLDPELLAAVAAQETGGPGSNGGANIVGDGGHGHGLFQIDDRWHQFARSAAAMDPVKNADYAAGMLSGLLKRYGGDVHKALSAYNAGSPDARGTTTTWRDGATLGYADSVLRHLQNLNGSKYLDDARAEAGEVSANVNGLAASFSNFSAPAHRPWRQIEGLDAAGNSRDDQANPFSVGDDE